MSYEIRFSDNSEQDLRDIVWDIFTQSKSVDISLRCQTRIIKSLEHLQEFPESGVNPKDRYFINYDYRYVIEGTYLIFYKILANEKVIRIMAILNGKRNYIEELKKRMI